MREGVSVTKFILFCFPALTEAFWYAYSDGSQKIHFWAIKKGNNEFCTKIQHRFSKICQFPYVKSCFWGNCFARCTKAHHPGIKNIWTYGPILYREKVKSYRTLWNLEQFWSEGFRKFTKNTVNHEKHSMTGHFTGHRLKLFNFVPFSVFDLLV